MIRGLTLLGLIVLLATPALGQELVRKRGRLIRDGGFVLLDCDTKVGFACDSVELDLANTEEKTLERLRASLNQVIEVSGELRTEPNGRHVLSVQRIYPDRPQDREFPRQLFNVQLELENGRPVAALRSSPESPVTRVPVTGDLRVVADVLAKERPGRTVLLQARLIRDAADRPLALLVEGIRARLGRVRWANWLRYQPESNLDMGSEHWTHLPVGEGWINGIDRDRAFAVKFLTDRPPLDAHRHYFNPKQAAGYLDLSELEFPGPSTRDRSGHPGGSSTPRSGGVSGALGRLGED